MLTLLINRLSVPFNIKLIVLRLLSQWRAQLILFMGVLLVAMIGTSIRLYTSAIAQIGLVERIEQEPLENVHLYVRNSLNRDEDLNTQWDTAHEVITASIEPFMAVADGWVDQFLQAGETLALPAEHEDGTRLSGNMRLAYYENLEQHVDVLEGDLFSSSTDDINNVAISLIAASRLELELGDIVVIRDVRDTSLPITLRIGAIITERNVQDAYMVAPSPLRVSNRDESNLFLSREVFTHLVQESIPEVGIQVNWRVLFDYHYLPINRVTHAAQQLDRVEDDLNSVLGNPVINGNLAPTLLDYTDEINSLGTPVILLLVQVGLLVLLFLLVIASLIWRGEVQEIDLFQTRGAHLRQILLSRAIEIAILCALSAIVAPYLAYSLLTQLLPRIMNTESVALVIEIDAFILSAIAAVIAWLVLMLSVTPILRSSLRIRRRNTGTKKIAWWYRYYLDIGVLILVIAELGRLLQRSRLNTASHDPLLLLTPTLLFLAVGGVLLRIFPLMMRLLARFVGSQASLSRALAVWQISREAPHYVRIIFLLSLAISIGWFATSFRSTFIRNLVDRAQYTTGADIRLPYSNQIISTPQNNIDEDYIAIAGVESVAHVIRDTEINPSIQTVSFDGGEALFVHHSDIVELSELRSDLGTMPAPYIDGSQFSYAVTGTEFPIVPEAINLELKLDLAFTQRINEQFTVREINGLFYVLDTTITAVLSDDYGNWEEIAFDFHPSADIDDDLLEAMFDVDNGDLQLNTDVLQTYLDLVDARDPWILLQAQLPDDHNLSGRITLESFNIYSRTISFVTASWSLHLRKLELVDTSGNITELGWLGDDSWSVTDASMSLEAFIEEQNIHWTQIATPGTTNFVFRILRNYPSMDALPVVASTAFLELNKLRIGNEFEQFVAGQSRRFVIVAETTYYPTLFGRERPFIVGDITTLLYDDLRQGVASNYDAEIWIKLAPSANVDEVMQAIRFLDSDIADEALVFTRVRNSLASDVLALGLIGLLFMAFLIVLALSIISLISFSWLNARQRQSEFAYMLALGIPPSRITLALVLEQVLIMAVSCSLGAILGIFLSRMVLPVLANSSSRTPVTPPFFIQTEVGALIQYGLILVTILFLVMVITIWIIRHLSLSQTLRLGEE